MSDDFEEDAPRRKKRGKMKISRKKLALVALVLAIFSAGAIVQHFVIEPLYGETISDKYTRCLAQQQVLDQRFVSCDNERKACEFQLSQCLGT